MAFEQSFDVSFNDDLEKLSPVDQQRVLELTNEIAENPRIGEGLKGNLKGLFKACKGRKLRVFYEIDWGREIVIFRGCGQRENIYP
jgi:mRNA-degrading endonuclease RelE of RelBE toxin-antitoxin system